MIKSYGNEFVAVRVQDPRIQNQGSWNSYVDFKIFLHTNSKAFTAKTSCVRRRYSEFVWLKKKMQKNCGLVPVPDLPSKSFFSFSNEEFLEKRRQGLQSFLEKVLHMTVCLSDSQLHLFLQTQLPVGHIQDCVQGHTPYTVTDAILTYASSNQGWTQEEDGIQERTPTPVPYESMESPAPHLPTLPSGVLLDPVSLTSTDPEDLPTEEAISEIHDMDTLELQYEETENPSFTALQENNHGEAVLEINSPAEATSVGDSQVESVPVELNEEGETHQGVGKQTCVEVHCTEEECLMSAEKELKEEHSVDDSEQTAPHTQSMCELISHEVECQRESIELAVQEPVSQVELAQLDSRHEENISGKDTNETAQLDASHEQVSETESHTEISHEEDHDVETGLEVTKAQGANQEKDIVEVDSDEEMPLCEEQDLDLQSHGETPADESRVGDSMTGEASPVETSHLTNGCKEMAPEDEHGGVDDTQAAARNTNTLQVEANVDPLPQECFNEADCIQETIIYVDAREDEEIPYMTNVGPATTLEEVSSGLEDSVEEPLNHKVQGNHHLESSDDHSTEEAILLAVELDSKDSIKSHERNVHESTADANLTVDQEKEP